MDDSNLKQDLLEQIETLAEEWDLSISVIANLAIALGLPVVRDIFESGNIEDVLDEHDLEENEECD